MVTASEKFIELFEFEVKKYHTKKEAFDATCRNWKEKFEFAPPFNGFPSFKKMFTYYHKKKKQKEDGRLIEK